MNVHRSAKYDDLFYIHSSFILYDLLGIKYTNKQLCWCTRTRCTYLHTHSSHTRTHNGPWVQVNKWSSINASTHLWESLLHAHTYPTKYPTLMMDLYVFKDKCFVQGAIEWNERQMLSLGWVCENTSNALCYHLRISTWRETSLAYAISTRTISEMWCAKVHESS